MYLDMIYISNMYGAFTKIEIETSQQMPNNLQIIFSEL